MKQFTSLLLCFLLLAALLCGCGQSGTVAEPISQSNDTPTQAPEETAAADSSASASEPIVGMWYSYLEFANTDFSSEEAFRADFQTVCQNCHSIGCNTLYVQVRPFSDALYPSTIYPWSGYLTGTQGEDPGYDPLAVMVELAHTNGLQLEAWVNPYRISTGSTTPMGGICDTNPAVLHPEWVKTVEGAQYFDPSNPEVQAMIVDGVREIVENYDVDGIQFDDYFYPTTEESFDAEEYSRSGTDLELSEWRRENVNALVRQVYAAIKEVDPDCRFGISPQGNPDNNYNTQYSNVSLWMTEEGYLDYVMPQLYWGFGYTLQGGSTRFAFENISAEWLAMPRREGVKLLFGLGAYRIGTGDGGANEDSVTQWNSGHNLADQTKLALECGVDGIGLYRYDFLFRNDSFASLSQQEADNLLSALQGE